MNYPNPQYAPPAYPPQFPQQPPAQQYPAQGYPAPAPVQYGQPYPGQFVAPPSVPTAPLAQATSLADFYNQPSSPSGPGISWKGKPEGTTYLGLVTRDVALGDVTQDIDYKTKQPKFRQGNPVFVMKVPLQVQPCQEFPEGEFTFYVRGQAKDELVRAMTQVGIEGAPKAGALIQVTLVQRKPNQSGNPTNVVQIQYTPDYNQVPQAPAPVQPQYAAPQQFQQPQAPVQYAQQPAVPVQQYAAPAPVAAPPVQYAAPAAAVPQVPSPVAPQAAVQQFQQGAPVPAPPAGLDPAAQAILQSLTAQPAQG